MPLSTPVGFIIYNRPDLTERVFAAIAGAQPTQLFVAADGPRSAEDVDRCEAARTVIRRVDWPCDVRTDFADRNLGCGRREATAFDWVFANVEEAILLEDDTLPSESFFGFCEEMLERYRHDHRIMHINGDNSVNQGRTADSYYFSKYIHGWGWASWRRAWQHYDYHMRSWPAVREARWLERVCDDSFEQAYWRDIFDRMHADPGEIDTWDYQWIYACWLRDGMCIAPNANLISNIGFNRPDAAHTRDDNPRANLPTSEIATFVHPRKVARHLEADRHSFDEIFGGRELRERDTALKGLP